MKPSNSILIDVEYTRGGLTSIPLGANETVELDAQCIACEHSLSPFLRVSNKVGTRVLEKPVCLNCGFSYFTRVPSRDWLHRFYSSNWDQLGKSSPSVRSENAYDRNIARLEELAPDRNAFILDVGAGFGHFLLSAQRAGYTNLFGIEASEHRARHCRDIHRLCVSELTGETLLDFPDIGEISGKFDVIHSHHVLEHVADIRQVLENIHFCLKPGGHVLFYVPYWPRHESLFDMAHFVGHLRHFTPNAIAHLLKNTGFTVDHIDESLCVVGTKKSGQQIDALTHSQDMSIDVQEIVSKKFSSEWPPACESQVSKSPSKFWLSGPRHTPTFKDCDTITIQESILRFLKKAVVGYNVSAPITGHFRKIWGISLQLRRLLIKLLPRIIPFEKFELAGTIMITEADESAVSKTPVLEFRYLEEKAVAKFK